MKNLIKKLNRIFQDYMREKRLKIGKYIYGVKLALTQHFRNKLIFIKA